MNTPASTLPTVALPVVPDEDIVEVPAPTIPCSDPRVQAWLAQWVDAVYARQPLPAKPGEFSVPVSAAGVALMDKFNPTLQSLVAQYPEEHRKNQLIPVLVLARALGAWQDAFHPSGADWLNMRTNLGAYQQLHAEQWREQFDGARPSALMWLSKLKDAVNYGELSDIQLTRITKGLKKSDNAASRFWSLATATWHMEAAKTPPQSIMDNLKMCAHSIMMAQYLHSEDNPEHKEPSFLNVDTLPAHLLAAHPLSLAVPVRDYHKGWDHHVRVTGREFALERAKSHYPDGIPDNPNDRVAHIKLIDDYYNLAERSFEPWRWEGMKNATVQEKALTWAWLTGWAPEYTWDQAVEAFGIYPPVEAVGREYTGQSTQWWLTASYEEKVEAAEKWIEGANYEMDAARKDHCNIDGFISDMFKG